MPSQVSQLTQDQTVDLNYWGPFDPTPEQLQNLVEHQRSIGLTLHRIWDDYPDARSLRAPQETIKIIAQTQRGPRTQRPSLSMARNIREKTVNYGYHNAQEDWSGEAEERRENLNKEG